jgi:hypothetical protein
MDVLMVAKKPDGERPLTGAERQALYRAKRAAGIPPVRVCKWVDRRCRAQRWQDAVAELIALQAGYRDWFDGMPPALRQSATGQALESITRLDLSNLRTVKPPRGWGRD